MSFQEKEITLEGKKKKNASGKNRRGGRRAFIRRPRRPYQLMGENF